MKRVCLTGVESTGKSALAPLLAQRFGGVVMAEYGRTWAETHGLDFSPEALREIAAGHLAARAAIEAQRPSLIIEDTDIVACEKRIPKNLGIFHSEAGCWPSVW